MSADGSTVVGQSLNASSINEAFRWTSSGGMVGLGFLPGGTASSAFAVSRDGSVIVGYGGSDAFRWTSGGGMQSLGFFGAARGVSADGSTVVGDDFGSTVFLWTQESGTRSLADILTKDYGLNLSGWTLTFAAGISADGNTIIGEGTDPSGHTEGWIATIPEPGTGLLVMSGVLSLAITRRGRRGVSA